MIGQATSKADISWSLVSFIKFILCYRRINPVEAEIYRDFTSLISLIGVWKMLLFSKDTLNWSKVTEKDIYLDFFNFLFIKELYKMYHSSTTVFNIDHNNKCFFKETYRSVRSWFFFDKMSFSACQRCHWL